MFWFALMRIVCFVVVLLVITILLVEELRSRGVLT